MTLRACATIRRNSHAYSSSLLFYATVVLRFLAAGTPLSPLR